MKATLPTFICRQNHSQGSTPRAEIGQSLQSQNKISQFKKAAFQPSKSQVKTSDGSNEPEVIPSIK